MHSSLLLQLDERIKRAVENVCQRRKLKIATFIEDAILDKLEELKDADEVKKLRHESFRPLQDVLKDLKKIRKV